MSGLLRWKSREKVESNPAYEESLKLARSQSRIQGLFQFLQFIVIIGLAGLGFAVLAFRPPPTRLIPDLFLWTGVPFLAAFITQLFRLYQRGANRLAELQAEHKRLQLHANQVAFEQNRIDHGLYGPLDFQGSRQLAEIVFAPPASPPKSAEKEPELNIQGRLPFALVEPLERFIRRRDGKQAKAGKPAEEAHGENTTTDEVSDPDPSGRAPQGGPGLLPS